MLTRDAKLGVAADITETVLLLRTVLWYRALNVLQPTPQLPSRPRTQARVGAATRRVQGGAREGMHLESDAESKLLDMSCGDLEELPLVQLV